MKNLFAFLCCSLALLACTNVDPSVLQPSTSICGDGALSGTEQCDDGNTISGDGCNASCAKEEQQLPLDMNPIAGMNAGNMGGNTGGMMGGNTGGMMGGNTGGMMGGNAGGMMGGNAGGMMGGNAGGMMGGNAGGMMGGMMGGNPQPAICGNGMIEEGEQCDDGNTINGDGCSLTCIVENMGDICGNGVIEGIEQCDDANLNSGDGCSSTCTQESMGVACGNGIIEAGEQCDDHNSNNGDGCSSICIQEGMQSTCGNAILEQGEQCDDGNQLNNDACLNTCVNAICGDFILLQGVEQCDDGNLINGDGCSNACHFENNQIRCGDGMLGGGEQCDDGNQSNTDACLNNCTNARCGDGFIKQGIEQCDDGNLNNGDGCSNICAIEIRPNVCGDGMVGGTEQCDDANQINTDACLSNCTSARCGDGFIRQGIEQCDDSNLNNGDGCSNICAVEVRPNVCGDGIVGGTEQCDDANLINTDACLSNCTSARCGDGFIQATVEQCDDSNLNNGDGCSNLCVIEAPSCIDDPMEPDNETFLANFFANDVDFGTICPGDFDLFQMTVCARGTLNVNLSFIHADGDIDTQLLDSDGITILTSSVGVTDQESLTYINNTNAEKTFYIKIYGVGNATNQYTISSNYRCDDILEDNDNTTFSTFVSDGDAFQNLVMATNDEDWFSFFACSPTGSVSISFAHAQGDLDLILYKSDGTTVEAISNSSNDSETVYLGGTTGFYYVKVFGFLGASNLYDITFDVRSTCQ